MTADVQYCVRRWMYVAELAGHYWSDSRTVDGETGQQQH